MVGELPEAAGVPVFAAFAALFGSLVHNIETVAGRADKGAGSATDAACGDGVPGRILEVIIQPGLDLLQVELLYLRCGQWQCFGVIWLREEFLVIGNQGIALLAEGFAGVAASLYRGQKQVATLGFIRCQPNRGAETGVVARCASQADDGGLTASLQEKLVLVVPGKDCVQHRDGSRIAGAHTDQHCFGKTGRIDIGDSNLLPFLLVGHDVFAQREEGLFAGPAR